MSATGPRQRAERLEGDDLAAFLNLCESDLPAALVVDRMHRDHGVIVAIARVYKARERLKYQAKVDGRGKYERRDGRRAIPSAGLCVRCKTAKATHPGLPVGMNGRVCLPCQKAVINGRAEERRLQIKKERALREALAMFPQPA